MPISVRPSCAYRTFYAWYGLLVMALLWYPRVACADTDDLRPSMFLFSGFGTLGVVHSSEDKADFTSAPFRPNGAGYSHDWSKDVDSLIAAQVTAQVVPRLTAVLQVVAEQNYDNTYRPHVEWANIRYQLTPDLSVRLGRTVLPELLLSDSRAVGYTYSWVRPPLELYRLLPITTADGVDIDYHVHVADVTNTVQAIIGKNYQNSPGDGAAHGVHVWGISNTTDYAALTLRVTYQKSDLALSPLNDLLDAFRFFGAQGAAIADRYDAHGTRFTLIGAGVSYDPGDWFVMSEWGHLKSDSVIGTKAAWYASGGYRFGEITPYVTYADATAANRSDPGLTLAALPPPLAATAARLNSALNSILSSNLAENSVSIGARWDFMKKVDLKLQFDHTRIGARSKGILTNTQPDFLLGGKLNVFSATVDFVF